MHSNHEYLAKICMHSFLRPLNFSVSGTHQEHIA
jgi:hypothetical protein